MVAIILTLKQVAHFAVLRLSEFINKHTNASNLGRTPTILVGVLVSISANHHLDIEANYNSIEILSKCIFQLEHSSMINEEQSHGYKKTSENRTNRSANQSVSRQQC